MFTNRRLEPYQLTGNWGVDGPRLLRVLNEFMQSLEVPQAIAITEASINGSPVGSEDPDTGAFTTVSASGLISADGGQVKFPATQNASSDVNTLDDYEEGHSSNSWTPVLTFATPGDVSVTYSQQTGTYTKVGDRVIIDFQIATSAFTHTTASGNVRISGFPFTVKNLDSGWMGGLWFQGITKANYTQIAFNPRPNTTYGELYTSGSGQSGAAIGAGDMPTGGTVILKGQASFVI